MALPSWRAADVDRRVAASLDDAVEGAAIDDQVLDEREGFGAPRLEDQPVVVLEPPHVQLADGRAGLGSVGDAVDEEPARAADSLAAVRVERDRILALPAISLR